MRSYTDTSALSGLLPHGSLREATYPSPFGPKGGSPGRHTGEVYDYASRHGIAY